MLSGGNWCEDTVRVLSHTGVGIERETSIDSKIKLWRKIDCDDGGSGSRN